MRVRSLGCLQLGYQRPTYSITLMKADHDLLELICKRNIYFFRRSDIHHIRLYQGDFFTGLRFEHHILSYPRCLILWPVSLLPGSTGANQLLKKLRILGYGQSRQE